MNIVGNNHGSIEKISDQWYVFYHRHTHNSSYSRQACAEKIEIQEDGSIPQVPVTSSGLTDSPLHAKGIYPAVIACWVKGRRTTRLINRSKEWKTTHITSKNNERFITNIKKKSFIGYKYFHFEKESELEITFRGLGNGCFIIIDYKGNNIGKINISPSESWRQAKSKLEIEGDSALYLLFDGKGKVDLKTLKFQGQKLM